LPNGKLGSKNVLHEPEKITDLREDWSNDLEFTVMGSKTKH